jgi:hypothetical protein
MKGKILSFVIATSLLAASCGTTYNSTSDNAAYNVTVPTGIRSDFAVSYPDATNVVWNRYDAATVPIDWELTGWTVLDADDYVVTFNMAGDSYYGWYDSNGALVGTAYAITDYSRLPYAVNTLLKNNYKDYTIEAVQRESWKSQTAYELKLKKADDTKIKLLVDANGNVLKEKLKD